MQAVAGPDIRCVVAGNPGPLTGPGTNTWIVGRGEVAVIDPGPAGDAAHVAAILAALAPGERVAAILVTHPHADHAGAVPALRAATGAIVAGHAGQDRAPAAPPDRPEAAAAPARLDRALHDGDAVAVGDLRLAVLHTPGHHPAHLAFRAGPVVFTGDTVMGWASTLIDPPEGDLDAYRHTLARLRDLGAARFLPGHGAPVDDPAARCTALLDHRRAREAAVCAALADGPATLGDLVARVYTDTPTALHAAASRNVLAHLLDLSRRGRVTTTADTQPRGETWRLAPAVPPLA